MLLNSVAKHSFVDAILKNGVTLLIGKEEIRDYSPRHEESFYKIPPKRIELYLSSMCESVSLLSSVQLKHNELYREYCDSKHQRRHIATLQEAVPSIKRHARKWAEKAVSTNRDHF